jgi:hypothetical protein
MAFKLFRRKKQTDSTLPPEIQAYAQGQHRERVGMAWLVGLISLIITVLVVFGAFFAGRWTYRKLAHKDTKATPTAQVDKKNADDKSKEKTKGQTKAKDEGKDSSHTETPAQAPAPTPPTTTPATGDSSGNTLVRTGPDVDL